MTRRQRLVLLLLLPLTWAAMVLINSLNASPGSSSDLSLWLLLAGELPLAAALLFAWQSEKLLLDFFQPELIGLFGWWISLVNGYIIAAAAPFVGLLPKAADLTDAAAAIDQPVNYLLLALVAGVAVFFLWFLFRPGGLAAQADRIYMPQRRTTLLLALGVLMLGISLLGGTSLGLALLPSAWLWIFIVPRADRPGKFFNGALAVGGLLYPLYLAGAALLAGGWWRLVLGAAYGWLTPLEVLVFLFWLALYARFFRLAFSRPYVAPAVPEDPLLALLKSQ